MQPILRPAAILLAAFTLSSCFQRTETGMINPDGSGKMRIDTTIASPDFNARVTKSQALAMAREFAALLIHKTTGVDAWENLQIEATPDGKAHVAATAYFPDLSQFRLEGAALFSWTKNPGGGFTLTLNPDAPSSAPTAATLPAPAMTDTLIAAKIKLARAIYDMNRDVAGQILANLKIDMTLTLPGPVLATNIFSKSQGDSVTLTIDGAHLLDAINSTMTDTSALEKSLHNGKEIDDNDQLILQKIFGKTGLPTATIAGPGKPLFDYQTQMQAARAAQNTMLKNAGLTLSPPIPSTPPPAK